jgi:hypothetical protein
VGGVGDGDVQTRKSLADMAYTLGNTPSNLFCVALDMFPKVWELQPGKPTRVRVLSCRSPFTIMTRTMAGLMDPIPFPERTGPAPQDLHWGRNTPARPSLWKGHISSNVNF